jgi:hypothetical protein
MNRTASSPLQVNVPARDLSTFAAGVSHAFTSVLEIVIPYSFLLFLVSSGT